MLHVFNKILVCTDFSQQSTQALLAAEKIRTITGGEITLLHVCFGFPQNEGEPNSHHKYLNSEVFSLLADQARDKMEAQLATAQVKSVNYLIKFGNTAETIIDFLEAEPCDVLFMGHGGKGRFKGLLGSVARKVITATHLPIMVVKKEYSNYKIAGLIDELVPSTDVIDFTFDFYRISQAKKIEFISMSDNSSLAEQLNAEVARRTQPEENPLIKIEHPFAYNIVYDLSALLIKTQVDVAVLKRSSKNKPRRIFLGSTTLMLLDVFPGNLLICPD